MSGTDDYLALFIEESEENLQRLNRAILGLEENPQSEQILGEIFRAAHSLKGMAATMDFDSMAKLTHKLEDVLDLCRNKDLTVTSELIDHLFQVLDLLEEMVRNIAEQGEEVVTGEECMRKLETFIADDAPKEAADISEEFSWEMLNEREKKILRKARRDGCNLYTIHVEINPEAPLKGARAFMVYREVEVEGQVVKSVPSIEALEEGRFEDAIHLYAADVRPISELKEEILSIADIKEVTAARIGDVALEPEGQKEDTPDGSQCRNLENRMQTGTTLRVDIEKMDTMMNLVGELVIGKSLLKGIAERTDVKPMNSVLEQIDRITDELQNTVMKARMVSVSRIFNRFPRMVRDISRELEKEIDFQMQGVETELDRTIIDAIGDPIVHLLRNAIDHGIEPPSERERKGKGRVGQINLSARQQGNSVIITVADDGQGLDRETILAKALNQGFLGEEEAEEMEEWEIYNLIFAPGFSMADEVTDLSGRGVGMDAVKTTIEALGGVMDVSSTKNEGTEFSTHLPLTIAIIQALLVQVGGETYAIPLSNIEEIIEISSEKLHRVENQDAFTLRGEILPLFAMRDYLGIQNAVHESAMSVVIVNIGKRRVGLKVDRFLRQQEIVIKTLSDFFSDLEYLTGGTILGGGELALILDVRRIF